MLAEAIANLSKNRELRERLGLKAREKVIEKFSLDKAAAALADLFKDG